MSAPTSTVVNPTREVLETTHAPMIQAMSWLVSSALVLRWVTALAVAGMTLVSAPMSSRVSVILSTIDDFQADLGDAISTRFAMAAVTLFAVNSDEVCRSSEIVEYASSIAIECNHWIDDWRYFF